MLIAHYKLNENTSGDNTELVTNGTFVAWTTDNPDNWDITGEVTTDPEVSEVDAGQGHGGTSVTGGFCNIYSSDGTSILMRISTADAIPLVVGRKYQVSITINTVILGRIGVSDVVGQWVEKTYGAGDIGIQTWTFIATETTCRIDVREYGAGTDVTFGDVSIKLLAVEDSSGNDHDALAQQDTNTIHQTGVGYVNGAFDFNGTSDFIDVGDIESDVKSIAIWVNPDGVTTHTDYLIDLNGTDYITIVNGTVTKNGFAGSTIVIYVDGVVSSTVTANWHHIVITSTNGFTASDLDIGRVEGSGYFGGLIDNVPLFDTILNIDQVKALYNGGHGTEIVEVIDLDRRIQRRQ